MAREKINLPLQQFLTLVGPATPLIIVDEDYKQERGDEPLFRGKAAKMRDYPELLEREVKLISPTEPENDKEAEGEEPAGASFWIWIY